jgi:hypothetical protein
MLERFFRGLLQSKSNSEKRRLNTVRSLREQYSAEHPAESASFESLQDELTDTKDPARREELTEQLANMPYYRQVDVPVQDAEHGLLRAKQRVEETQSKN